MTACGSSNATKQFTLANKGEILGMGALAGADDGFGVEVNGGGTRFNSEQACGNIEIKNFHSIKGNNNRGPKYWRRQDDLDHRDYGDHQRG